MKVFCQFGSCSLQIIWCSCILCTIKQVRPNEFELECRHTIKSHGRQLARDHKHDWLILLLLVVIEIILNVIHPFYRFVGEGMMSDLMYPMKDNTVPIWAVPVSRTSELFKTYHCCWHISNDVFLLVISCMQFCCLLPSSFSTIFGGETYMICTIVY